MMKHVFAFAMILFILPITIFAEIPCICGQEDCLCFIQMGDEGHPVEAIQNQLVSQGYLAQNDDASIFDENTKMAVIAFQLENNLEATGMMDDDTLTLLLWGLLPDELDQVDPLSIGKPVWIPTDGGIRHHKRATCCAMLDPRLISQRNALKMEMTRCGRCRPDGSNTELNDFTFGR